jgi:hypothetical protein
MQYQLKLHVDKVLQYINKHQLDGRLTYVVAIERFQNITALLKSYFGDLTCSWLGMDKLYFTITRLFYVVCVNNAYKFKQTKLVPRAFSQLK